MQEAEVLFDGELCDLENFTIPLAKKKLTRKRSINPHLWKQNVRKRQREQGEQYVDIKGKVHRARQMQSRCNQTCKYNCLYNFPEDGRVSIFNAYWNMNDSKKLHFFSKFVKQSVPARRRIKVADNVHRKKSTNLFFFQLNGVEKRVCKSFFLSTLDVTDNQIAYYFKEFEDKATSIPRSPIRGRNQKKHISTEVKNEVIDHINSFPRVESHYCRALTKRQYLDPQLSVPKMHQLYKELPNVKQPVKLSMYRNIFNTEFNLAFHHPKKDRCDKCAEFNAKSHPTNEEKADYEVHMKRRDAGRTENKNDKENPNPRIAVIKFDLENVFTFPQAFVSCLFYLRKLSAYNLTVHCSIDNMVHCVIWHEYIIGRGGNEIGNAVVKALECICKQHPELTTLILWSDSCVPQNKNSMMSTALASFVQSAENNITLIEQKFGEPGHGNIQEVDSAHSIIESYLRDVEIWSPLALIAQLEKLQRASTGTYKFNVIPLIDTDELFDYSSTASTLLYSKVPYTKVKQLSYSNDDIFTVKYKKDFEDPFTSVRVCKADNPDRFPDISKGLRDVIGLASEKLADITKMMKYMTDESDINFYRSLTKVKEVQLNKLRIVHSNGIESSGNEVIVENVQGELQTGKA